MKRDWAEHRCYVEALSQIDCLLLALMTLVKDEINKLAIGVLCTMVPVKKNQMIWYTKRYNRVIFYASLCNKPSVF